jgi:hypothetical protein
MEEMIADIIKDYKNRQKSSSGGKKGIRTYPSPRKKYRDQAKADVDEEKDNESKAQRTRYTVRTCR